MSKPDTRNDSIDAVQSESARSSGFSISSSIDDDLAGSSSSSKKNPLTNNGGMILLLVVVAVAGALLLGMRKLGLAGRLELVDIKIDYPFDAHKDAVVGPDHEEVIQDLKSSSDIKQVPPELVQMNPFEWKTETKAQTEDLAAKEAEKARLAAAARKKEIDGAFSKLTLNSVMGGRIPVAQISGQLVRVGDDVGTYFTVLSIEGRTVTLVATNNDKFVMTLE